MALRSIGVIYLVGVVADGALSMLAIALPVLEGPSDAFSLFMHASGIAVFVLAVFGRLRPRAAFIIPVLLYWIYFLFGVVLAVALAAKVGAGNVPEDAGLSFITSVFPWFGPANWVLLAVLMTVGVLCLQKYTRSLTERTNQQTVALPPTH